MGLGGWVFGSNLSQDLNPHSIMPFFLHMCSTTIWKWIAQVYWSKGFWNVLPGKKKYWQVWGNRLVNSLIANFWPKYGWNISNRAAMGGWLGSDQNPIAASFLGHCGHWSFSQIEGWICLRFWQVAGKVEDQSRTTICSQRGQQDRREPYYLTGVDCSHTRTGLIKKFSPPFTVPWFAMRMFHLHENVQVSEHVHVSTYSVSMTCQIPWFRIKALQGRPCFQRIAVVDLN